MVRDLNTSNCLSSERIFAVAVFYNRFFMRTHRSKFAAVAAVIAAALIASACTAGGTPEVVTEETLAPGEVVTIDPFVAPAVYPLQISDIVTPVDPARPAPLDNTVQTDLDLVYQMILEIYKIYRDSVVLPPDPEAVVNFRKMPPIEDIDRLKDKIALACALRPSDENPDSLALKIQQQDKVWNRSDQVVNRFMLWATYAFQYDEGLVPTEESPEPQPDRRDLCGNTGQYLL